jgi:hypothetical protein
MASCSEPHAGGVGVGVEVASYDHMSWPFGDQAFQDPGGGDGLELAFVFVVELPAR